MAYRPPRDVPPEDRYGERGQSYRPGNARDRSPPRRDRDVDGYGARSPPRRAYDARGPPRRSRSPPGSDGYRRRSPSPRDRWGPPRGGDSYRTRPRSPPRRDDFAREGLFRRDERRDFRDNRSPRDRRDFGGRSPPLRDRSPPGNGRSPFGARRFSPEKRDRSPLRRFDDHSRPHSPPRRGMSPRGSARDFGSRPRSPPSRSELVDNRRRSLSPRSRNRQFEDKGGESSATSRRSSPPVHASRLALLPELDVESRSGGPSPRGNNSNRSLGRSPDVRRPSLPRDRDGDMTMQDTGRSPPRAQASRMTDRPPVREPPAGPSADRQAPNGPAPPRPPPAGPRSDNISSRGGFAPRGRGGFNPEYQGRTSITATFHNARGGSQVVNNAPSFERESPSVKAPPVVRPFAETPTRPAPSRAASMTTQSQRFDAPREPRSMPTADSFRRPVSNTTAIPVGPAGDRSRDTRSPGVHPALRDLPEILPGGKKLPPVVDCARLYKLEEEAEKLRKIIDSKDVKKRKSMREWERLTRESESAAFRSELAETSIRTFDGQGEHAGVAF